jgi:hypothetical protein
VINNKKWFWYGRILMTNKESGLYSIINGSEYLFYKYPAKTGDTYKIPSITDTLNMEIIAINEQLTVKAGTFYTYHYRYILQLLPISVDEWLAPNIGLVRRDVKSLDNGNYITDVNNPEPYSSSTEELLSYSLK